MLQNLILDRPLAAIDLETTGLIELGDGWPSYPRIVEIAVVRVDPSQHVDALVRRLNPEIPIPPAATRVHGITDAQAGGYPTFLDALGPILDLLVDCDLTGFNLVGFDLPVIQAELARAGLVSIDLHYRKVIDSMALFHRYYPPPTGTRGLGTLAAACRRYLGSAPVAAHGALWDAMAAVHVLDAQIAWHGLPGRLAELVETLDAPPERSEMEWARG